MDKLIRIYRKLLNEFGCQKWWPTTLEGELHPTYHGRKNITEKQAFEIAVGAILTQNTSWKNVEKAIVNLNKKNLVRIEKIKKISRQKLAELIKPSGYYNQKAERLKIAAEFFSRNSIKKLKMQNPEAVKKLLLEIKGIGPETADSIMLYSLNMPVFVVDAYTRRVFSRLGVCDEECKYDELQQIFHSSLPNEEKLFNEYHALIVELAKRHCTKKPCCTSCPIASICKKDVKNV